MGGAQLGIGWQLQCAAARRHELTRAKAIQALRELDRAGTPVTFAAVASAARISRSWLYTQPDISDQIRRLRGKTDGAGSAGAIPAGQPQPYGSAGVDINCAPTANLAPPAPNSQFPPR